MLQTHDAALAGLKGLAVFAVHGAEAYVDKLCVPADQAGLGRRAEDLGKVKFLALVSDIDDLVGAVFFNALLDRSQIGRRIEGGAVRLQDDTGRDLLGVGLLSDVNDQSALALIGIAALFHLLDHAGDHGVDAGLAVPQIKADIEVFIVALHVRHGDCNDLLPEGVEAALSVLQTACIVHGLGVVFGVLFGFGAGKGIDLFEFGDGKGRLIGIFALKRRVKIRKSGHALFEFRDHEAHLQAPVSQMDITDDILSVEAGDALDRLADDRAAQMSDMQGLGHIGTAVVDDDLLRLFRKRHAETIVRAHLLQVRLQKALFHIQIQETGLDDLHLGKYRGTCAVIFGREGPGNVVSDHKGRFAVALCTCHGTVALIFAEVRAVRYCHPAQCTVISRRLEGGFHLF